MRALALFRISIGSVFLIDLVIRALDITMFYGDQGVLSRESFLKQTWLIPTFQPFLATGNASGLTVLFCLGALSALFLISGYKTRAAGLACWYFCCQIQLRNPLVLDGGDDLLRLLLFWVPFLPVSARWSVESHWNKSWSSLSNNYRSLATVAIYLQFGLLYFFAALLKNGDDWKETGDALFYALSMDQFATQLGQTLTQYPELLRHLTVGALLTEFALALLLFCPQRVKGSRLAFLGIAFGFHISIALMLHFGIFMLIAMCGLVVFIPGSFFDNSDLSASKNEPLDSVVNPAAYELTRIETIFAGFICCYMIWVNVLSVQHVAKLPGWTHAVARITYQHQHWHLFAPDPLKHDGWFSVEVLSKDGQTTAYLGPNNSKNKPQLISNQFPNQRWRRWLQNLVHTEFPDRQQWRKATLDYLIRFYLNDSQQVQMRTARLLYFQEVTAPPGQEATIKKLVLAEKSAP